MIIHGDSLDVLKTLDDESVDVLVTDPPYGYGFMGKSWDKALPDIGIFRECLRVLKPGAFAFVMSAPRSDVCSRMAIMLEDAGFNIAFTPIYWTYASGFPKALKMGKKGGPEGAYAGFQPKPAVEVIIVAMKPLSEKTYVDQALKNGKGVTWLDDCRIPSASRTVPIHSQDKKNDETMWGLHPTVQHERVATDLGRFPANLLVSDDVLNDGKHRHAAGNKKPSKMEDATSFYSGKFSENTRNPDYYGDSGSYSRYFDLDAWAQTLPFLVCPKASKSEKNAGLEHRSVETVSDGRQKAIDNAFQRGKTERKNIHPTVKPLKLMSYLITLGSRPGDLVLDPFAGSFTTCVAAKQLGRNFIGIEREKEYVEIGKDRLTAIVPSLL